MALELIKTIEEESNDLALHTKLCYQRHGTIMQRLDEVDARLDKIDDSLVEIKDLISDQKQESSDTYLKWAIAVISGLAGFCWHLLQLLPK